MGKSFGQLAVNPHWARDYGEGMVCEEGLRLRLREKRNRLV